MPFTVDDSALRLRGRPVSMAFGDATGLKNLQQLIQLRWIAVAGQLVTIAVAKWLLEIDLPLETMGLTLAALVAFNLASLARWRTRREVGNTELFIALLVDAGVLTVQLHFSGGTTNPFVFLFLLQVILSAMLLKPWSAWTMVGVTSACIAGLALVSDPLELPLDHDRGLLSPYVQGTLICFALDAALLVFFIKRIGHNLRARDAYLARMRQRAAEEEHIVRMGLLASGAAHELGTPLATMSVIVGDWRHMPELAGNPELLQEVEELQAQVQRCKKIVSGILLSAGEARGENSGRTTIATFLDRLVAEWRASRTSARLSYLNRFGDDLAMVSDSTVQQMVFNVLDNAAEVSPQDIRMEAARIRDDLVLTIADSGPGFAPRMLAEFGKPYQSSKGRAGGGLGLFLVVNVARTLGGRVSARNQPQGGAVVTLTLPLSVIALDED